MKSEKYLDEVKRRVLRAPKTPVFTWFFHEGSADLAHNSKRQYLYTRGTVVVVYSHNRTLPNSGIRKGPPIK